MGPVEQSIFTKLTAHFAPNHLQVINESGSHNVPAGSETHFKLVLVTDSFVGMSRVKRQQSVYKLLDVELDGPVHALSMVTVTTDEWSAMSAQVPQSPPCLGGED